MASNTKVVLENTTDGYLAEGTSIRGGYFVIDSLANIATNYPRIAVEGSLCYCQSDDKFYVYNGSSWEEMKTGGSGIFPNKFLPTIRTSKVFNHHWKQKTWSGYSGPTRDSIWTDGIDIYVSNGSSQYVLDKSTSTWNVKTWYGLTEFYQEHIWTDGENIYYSYGSSQYVLDRKTSTWNPKTWDGSLTSFDVRRSNTAQYPWSDGENIYYKNSSKYYYLDKTNYTNYAWVEMTWNGISSIYYDNSIWTDGIDIYYSNSSNQYVLDKSTKTWYPKTWIAITWTIEGTSTIPHGSLIWTDGNKIYSSFGSSQFVLDINTSEDVMCKPTIGIDFKTQIINAPQSLTTYEIDNILDDVFNVSYYEDALDD